ncbi:aldolase/citrate lyase family protein (plasmid) [Agrobacterium leguminum]|uniref:HpcH/HpaI aldolase family protein n=1 Tax=Agrobacterium leguminum TaxID=2792015 RepID=UPI00272A3165|nr:aldolase/citrate lyase family protein [Agrobacterium leguminum]WLE00699.1 aldolase/citrate lyase family protein [Agrobacterium leguminum]
MAGLRGRLREGELLLGTFIKTPSPHMAELLGLGGLDFAVVDREHAPIGIEVLDLMVGAARGVGLPLLVRIPTNEPVSIAAALDCGAAGVLVPHVRNAGEAQAIVDAAKYSAGHRGFSPSARAGLYGTIDPVAYRSRSDAESVLIAQIEDREALDHLDAIAAIEEIDALFIGPADLALSLGCGPADTALDEAIERIIAVGKRHSKPVAMFTGRHDQVAGLVARGITAFVCGSDQSMVLAGARQIRAAATVQTS